ncbi:MAG: glycosyltransferase family 9 protein [Deltaproteobacteria bacterium]|nr:glycosyltransferase family 9 protein [Deltaproteobacteria bacterium]
MLYQNTALGDALFATPALRAVRKTFPQAHLALVCRSRHAPLMALNPHLDELLIYRGKAKSFRPLVRALKRGQFEVAVILHGNDPETLPLLWTGRVGSIVGPAGTRFEFLQSLTLPPPNRTQHVVDHRLMLVQAIGAKPQGRHLEQPLDQNTLTWAQAFIGDNLPGQGPAVIIAPGASSPHKRWPAERFAKVAQVLQDRHKARIIILTTAKESPLADRIVSGLSGPWWAANGRLDLLQVAGLMAVSRLVLANDSGLYNLGQALRIPTLSLGGPQGPADYGPLPGHGAEMISLRAEVCPWPDCLNTACPDPVCIKAITEDMVLARLEEGFSEALTSPVSSKK